MKNPYDTKLAIDLVYDIMISYDNHDLLQIYLVHDMYIILRLDIKGTVSFDLCDHAS